MDLAFRGDVVDFYHRYRRGYPPEVIDVLADAFELTADDLAVDLGCGTGQLAVPLASRVGTVLGVDPEPDMLAKAASEAGGSGVEWIVGTDRDLPTLLAGRPAPAAVTVAQALHWMDSERLFAELRPVLRPGGGITVVTNGAPLWQQDAPWSRALRDVLAQWLGAPLTNTCGTAEADQERYRTQLRSAGYGVTERRLHYQDELDLDRIVGGTLSAFRADQLPAPDERQRFAGRVHEALAPHAPFVEEVRVGTILGKR